MNVKTIGVLTSGGDAPGMNAAVRAVVRAAIKKDMKVLGVMRGYNGLINGDMVEMNMRSVSDMIQRGGTILYTARCKEFREMEGVLKAKTMCEKVGMDGLVVIGGDGSFRGAGDLSSVGIPCVGLPGTIDNDIACTEYTIGYDTAMNTAVEMVDKIRDTAQSHDRCSVVEVMGRRAGYIALNCGIGLRRYLHRGSGDWSQHGRDDREDRSCPCSGQEALHHHGGGRHRQRQRHRSGDRSPHRHRVP